MPTRGQGNSLPAGTAGVAAAPAGWTAGHTPLPGNGTRLVTRVRAVYDWRHPLLAVFGVLLLEFGDFPMMRRMLRGIKSRAEGLARDVVRSAAKLGGPGCGGTQ